MSEVLTCANLAEAVQLILWRIQQNDRDVLAAVKRALEGVEKK